MSKNIISRFVPTQLFMTIPLQLSLHCYRWERENGVVKLKFT